MDVIRVNLPTNPVAPLPPLANQDVNFPRTATAPDTAAVTPTAPVATTASIPIAFFVGSLKLSNASARLPIQSTRGITTLSSIVDKAFINGLRSEEHTSELQSRGHLV